MTNALTFGTDKMLIEKAGGIGTLIFNNPEKRNAVSFEMWAAAKLILDDFEADDSVRVVVVTGAGGKAFVSGADISKFGDERAEAEAVARYNAQTEAIYAGLHSFPKPTIGKIRGFCIGGGLGLAASCDIRIATEDSRFALPAARLGLGYGLNPLKRLAEVVGIPFAKEIFFTARQFTSREAETMGLVNRVVAADEIDDFVANYSSMIAANAPLTVATAKFAFKQLSLDPAKRDHEACAARVQQCFASRDYGEGRLAFMEKRQPVFTGT